MKYKLLIIVNVDWFFLSHRLPIAVEAVRLGYEVHIATTITGSVDKLERNGLIVHPLNIHRSHGGLGVIFSEFFAMLSVIRVVVPDVVHLVTIKPVLLGGVAARIARVPAVVSAVSGLGFIFVNNDFIALLRRKAISFFYRLAFGHLNQKIIFQNVDDRNHLSKLAQLSADKTVLIHGSGVDLSLYSKQPIPDGRPVVLLAARLLGDKGVREFVKAAERINTSVPRARFVLVGEVDPLNPSSIKQQELNEWTQANIIESWGYRDDMEQVFASAMIVVLPSYYGEGLPKVLIEAAACGRVIVTTDHPGCRDAIENDVTGLLVPVRNAEILADKISFLLGNPERCEGMGDAGRTRAEEMFDVRKVVAKHMQIYNELLEQSKG